VSFITSIKKLLKLNIYPVFRKKRADFLWFFEGTQESGKGDRFIFFHIDNAKIRPVAMKNKSVPLFPPFPLSPFPPFSRFSYVQQHLKIEGFALYLTI